MKKISLLAVSITAPFLAGFIGSFFTYTQINSWYAYLAKPPLNPPNWIFGPVWTTLYFLMGISFYLILQSKKSRKREKLIYLFIFQLILNALWSIIFFGLQNLFIAFVVIVMLAATIIYIIKLLLSVNKTGAYLLIPYILWVSFAGYLNLAIALLN